MREKEPQQEKTAQAQILKGNKNVSGGLPNV